MVNGAPPGDGLRLLTATRRYVAVVNGRQGDNLHTQLLVTGPQRGAGSASSLRARCYVAVVSERHSHNLHTTTQDWAPSGSGLRILASSAALRVSSRWTVRWQLVHRSGRDGTQLRKGSSRALRARSHVAVVGERHDDDLHTQLLAVGPQQVAGLHFFVALGALRAPATDFSISDRVSI